MKRLFTIYKDYWIDKYSYYNAGKFYESFCRHANFTRRLVDNAAQAHVVPRVYDDGQIAVDVLDLLAVKEALAAHNAVRDARAGKVGLDRVGLSVHAVDPKKIIGVVEVNTPDQARSFTAPVGNSNRHWKN